jgi:arylsulfatase B
VYEGGIRIPFLVQWKGTLPAKQVFRHPVISLDVFATAAAVAKAPLPRSRRIDGRNLIPFLTGENTKRPHETLFWRLNQRTAIRVGDWKLVRNPRGRSDADWHLFHLGQDLSESNDIARQRPEKFQELQIAWKRMNDQMIEPIWKPRK